jgi:hypothetical protein
LKSGIGLADRKAYREVKKYADFLSVLPPRLPPGHPPNYANGFIGTASADIPKRFYLSDLAIVANDKPEVHHAADVVFSRKSGVANLAGEVSEKGLFTAWKFGHLL